MRKYYQDNPTQLEEDIKEQDTRFTEEMCPIAYQDRKEAIMAYFNFFGYDNLAGKNLAIWLDEKKHETGAFEFDDICGIVYEKALDRVQEELGDKVESINELCVRYDYDISRFVARDESQTEQLIDKIKGELREALQENGFEWGYSISETAIEVFKEMSIPIKQMMEENNQSNIRKNK